MVDSIGALEAWGIPLMATLGSRGKGHANH
jgi:hypothetical protein